MKNLIVFLVYCATLGLSNIAMAGSGDDCHFHGSKHASESIIIKCTEQRKTSLVQAGKLETTWNNIKHETIAMVDGKNGKEWRIVYKNPTATDKKRTSLFMFFTPIGNFIAANHTGQ